jgi:NAD(P)-dependent dehydrogenase (short-subunit alcohol dehydrogenase family)
LCSQAVIPALRQSRGAIVNIGSISGLRASTLRVAYGTSKAAVIHMTKQQARTDRAIPHSTNNRITTGPCFD